MFVRKTFLIVVCLCLSPVSIATTFDWSAVGLRVAVREILLPIGPTRLPYVVAVQEGGPAFYAGVQPGDAVSFLKCGSWNLNFIENVRNGGAYFPSYSAVNSQEFSEYTDVDSLCKPEREGLISVAIPSADKRRLKRMIEFRTDMKGTGKWLDTKAEVTDILGSARATKNKLHAELLGRAEKELLASPCSYDVSNPYDLTKMPPIIREITAAEGGSGTIDPMYWRDVVQMMCDEERRGKLPSFESALVRMSKGWLNPCEYDGGVNYGNLPLNPERRERRYSRTEYESLTDFNYMLVALLNDTQRKCFYDLVRSALTKR
jgi:hypothetical protein